MENKVTYPFVRNLAKVNPRLDKFFSPLSVSNVFQFCLSQRYSALSESRWWNAAEEIRFGYRGVLCFLVDFDCRHVFIVILDVLLCNSYCAVSEDNIEFHS